jgi:hypothetical protein
MENIPSRVLIIIQIMIVLVIPGCNFQTNKVEKRVTTPTEVISEQAIFKIQYENQANQVKVGQTYHVEIQNQTDICYSFPANFGLTYSINSNGIKYEFKDGTIYSYSDPEIINQKGEMWDNAVIPLYPEISGLTISEKTKIIAKISGNYCDDPDKAVIFEIPYYIMP